MYNRYIPQPDGSYRRSRVPEPNRRSAPVQKPAPPCPPPAQEPPKALPCHPPKQEAKPHCPPPQDDTCRPRQEHRPPCQQGQSIGSFFKQLLPKDLDTGDLLIILLLLLMAGDCAEDQNTALLTLALYFFM